MMETTAKYNLSMNRDLFVMAEPRQFEVVRTMVKSLYFLSPKPHVMMPQHHEDPFFVMAVVNFSSSLDLQSVVRSMSELTNPLAHKIIYVQNPDSVSAESLLLAQEIGVRYVAFGPTKVDDVREFLKRVCVEEHKAGSIDVFAKEFAAAFRNLDHELIRKTIVRLRETGAEGEETHKLLYYAYAKLNDNKMAEFQLKQILQINRQNLWAANTLGRLLLQAGKVSEGIEILERLSLFHNLNAERILNLGHAYADVGEIGRAEELFKAGHEMHESQDPRFQTGLAKVRLAQGNINAALRLAGANGFSEELIRFLNMRAVLAIRRGKISQALSYYSQALQGAADSVVKAKLFFNMGLACVRNRDLKTARDHFLKSIALGGKLFRRAEAPLSLVNGLIERSRTKPTPFATERKAEMMEEVEFETMF